MSVDLRVLFVCVHHAARSRMAEPLLRQLGGPRFEVTLPWSPDEPTGAAALRRLLTLNRPPAPLGATSGARDS